MFNSNASSADGGVPYIEDVFSTYLYTGNDTAQTITNGIDLSTKGGLVWIKSRSAAELNCAFDTARGVSNYLFVNATNAQINYGTFGVTAFNTNGFSLTGGAGYATNTSAETYASWTFREQEKFFDVVTWTGSGANRTIAHSLGSVPGCIMVKRTDAVGAWQVYHRSLANTEYLVLNDTAAKATGATRWNSTTATSAVFSLGTDATVNASSGTYVAYIFAHDAGGFGLTGTDNVISCGSFTTDGSGNATVSLGYEPQWVLIKQTDGVDSWYLNDNMRGMAVSGNQPNLSPNSSAAESAGGYNTYPNATGFTASVGIASKNYIYIAIRRGPMKVPTDATKVFVPVARTGTSSATTVTAGFPIDLSVIKQRAGTETWNWSDRLRGNSAGYLVSSGTFAEQSNASRVTGFASNTALSIGNDSQVNFTATTYSNYFFQRAPGFFDEVCYTGTGSNASLSHNLTVVPQLAIIKKRDGVAGWVVGSPLLSNTAYGFLNDTTPFTTSGGNSNFQNTAWSSQYLYVGDDGDVNGSGQKFVAYLFATCAGVSKVGTYTGTATTKQIDCGFTGGARFVMIKRTDSTADWYIYDSARGIIAGNDPYLLINSSAAEVTSTDYVDTYAAGFELSSTAPAALNASGGTYLFLAIA